MKLTAATVSEIMDSAVPNKTKFYFDDDLVGFGMYRTPGGTGTFFAEFRPVAGGSKKRIKLGRVGTLKANEAREAARKAISHAGLGKDLAKDRADERASVTVKALVEKYIDEFVAVNKKASSAEFYRIMLRKHIEPRIGTTKAVALTRVDVQRAHAAMSKTARISANRAMKLLSAAYGWGAKIGYVPEGFNPASGVDLNREEGRERFLTVDEMKRLGEAMIEAETVGFPVNAGDAKHAPKGQRIKMHPSVTGAIRLIMLTGCRLREILHLRWSEVDMERGLLFLPDSKTGRKTVVLSAAALAVLKEMPRVGIYVVAGDSASMPDEKPRADLKRPWAAITKRAGLDGLRIHDLRHSFASVGAWSGLGLPVIGKLLGHADVSTTQRYAHIADDAARRGADVIANQIADALGGEVMAKLPPDLDLDAVWIEEAMHRGDRQTAIKLLDKSIASGRAGKATMRLAGYLRGAKRGRQPFGAKHRWFEIGRDDEEMRSRGVPHAERMEKLALQYRLNDESKLKTAIAQYNKMMDALREIDRENEGR